MRVIISAGGTGGHIYPALAIINKIKEENPKSEFLYIGTTDRMEKDIVPSYNINYKGIKIAGINRSNPFKNITLPYKFNKSIKEVINIMKEFKPDIVIGVGGYVTAPVLIAANKLKIKTLIHEQNSVPGITNKLLSKKVDVVCTSLLSSNQYFPKEKVVYTGNPMSEETLKVKKESKSKYGFTSSMKLVVIVMGSLGSVSILNKLKEVIPLFKNKNYQVLLITGNNNFQIFKDVNISENVKIVPYVEGLNQLLKDTDLLISRAGASTIAEITALGLPSILIPSPYVSNNHQLKNALFLKEANACEILEEKELTTESLINSIDNIFDNITLQESISKNAKSLSVDNSLTLIYEEINKLAGEK